MDFLKSKNTLSLLYNYDRENDTTNIYFDLKQDNKTFTVSQSANVIVNYYNLTDGKSNIWQVQRDETGRLYSNVKDFKDINNAGKYSVVVNVDGTMFPSQGQTIFNIEEKTTPIGTHLILLKGDAGTPGEDGVSVKNITIDENGNITTTLSDDTTRTSKITLPDKLKGADGKDAPSVTGVHFNENQTELIFDMSDSSEHIATFTPPTNGRDGKDGKNAAEFTGVSLTPDNYLKFEKSDNTSLEFKMPNLKGEKGDKGDPGEPGVTGPAGQAGKDAPTISNVTFSNNSLTFNLSDGSKQSVTIPTIQGPAGENGKDGKDAAKITGAKFNADQTQIIFSLDDGTSFTTNFIPPKNGTNGTNGKDAANFTNVEYSNNSLIFTLSDGKTITATLPDLKGKDGVNGKDGVPGKDAATITGVKVENGKLIFTFSDGTSQSADLPDLKGKDGINVTGAKLQDKSLIFTLSDSSNITVDVSSLVKPDLETHVDGAATTILQYPTAQTKPKNNSYINASISENTPTLSINYNMEPLQLTYDKNYNELILSASSLGNLQSYKVDFSEIFNKLNYKIESVSIFPETTQKVTLNPNADNLFNIKFNLNYQDNTGTVTQPVNLPLNINTTQLGNGKAANDNKIKFYDLFVKGPKSGKYMVNEAALPNRILVVKNPFLTYAPVTDSLTEYRLYLEILPLLKNNILYYPNSTTTLYSSDFVNSLMMNIELNDAHISNREHDNDFLPVDKYKNAPDALWNSSIIHCRTFPKSYLQIVGKYIIFSSQASKDNLETYKGVNLPVYPNSSNIILDMEFVVNNDR